MMGLDLVDPIMKFHLDFTWPTQYTGTEPEVEIWGGNKSLSTIDL